MRESDLEAKLALALRVEGITDYETEYRFHPTRFWRFDLAWPSLLLAVEVQGGLHMTKGGHNTASGITRDCEKGNEAQLLGWTILHVTGDQIDDGSAIDWIWRALRPQGMEVASY